MGFKDLLVDSLDRLSTGLDNLSENMKASKEGTPIQEEKEEQKGEKKLYLVGTCHVDLNGPKKLEKFLNYSKPRTIAVELKQKDVPKVIGIHEVSKLSAKLFGNQLEEVVSKKEHAGKIREFMSLMGYEVWVSNDYKKSNPKTNLLFLDEYEDNEMIDIMYGSKGRDSKNNNEKFETREEKLSKLVNYMKNLDFEGLQKEVVGQLDNTGEEIEKIQEMIKKEDILLDLKKFQEEDPENFDKLLVQRDIRVEPKIRAAFKNTNRTLMYIGGSNHFFGDYYNLSDRLTDLNPIRVDLMKGQIK